MGSYEEFVTKQNEIYEKNFRQRQELVRREGILVDPVVTARKGGLGLVFRHDEVTAFCAATSALGMADHAPLLRMQQGDIHTTIAFRSQDDFVYDPVGHAEVVHDLAEVMERMMGKISRAVRRECRVACDAPLYNQHAVIIPGQLNPACFGVLVDIWQDTYLASHGFPEPWGGHITLGRFREAKPAAELTEFFGLVDWTEKFGFSRVKAIDLAYSEISPHALEFRTLARYEF